MAGNVSAMFEEFKELSELKEYATSQYKTILALQKKIAQLEEETSQLKRMLSETTPIISAEPTVTETTDEELISRAELRKLRNKAMSDPDGLTYEEVKKLDILAKTLNATKNKPKQMVIETKNKSSADLLKALVASDDE